MDGSPLAQQKLLKMRANCAFYCEILDYYAPAVVGNAKWNNDTNMEMFCTTYDTKAFAKHVLTYEAEKRSSYNIYEFLYFLFMK